MPTTTLLATVKPNAKQTAVTEGPTQTGPTTVSLSLRLNAQPKDGEANTELIRFLAKTLGVPKTQLTLTAGHTSRTKRLEIPLPPEHILTRLTTSEEHQPITA